MAPYGELYTYCQSLDLHIGRNEVLKKVEEIIGQKIAIVSAGLDIAKVRGYFLSSSKTDSGLVKQQKGAHVIVIGRANNRCWTRFVIFKELMHCFDHPLERTSSRADFGGLIEEFSSPNVARSLQMESEVKALWMALGIVCPEQHRIEFQKLRDDGKRSDMDIAKELLIPAQHIPSLFHPNYKEEIKRLAR